MSKSNVQTWHPKVTARSNSKSDTWRGSLVAAVGWSNYPPKLVLEVSHFQATPIYCYYSQRIPCSLPWNLCNTFWQHESPAANSLVCTWADLKNLQDWAVLPKKQTQDEPRGIYLTLPLRLMFPISVDSCAELGWQDTFGNILVNNEWL